MRLDAGPRQLWHSQLSTMFRSSCSAASESSDTGDIATRTTYASEIYLRGRPSLHPWRMSPLRTVTTSFARKGVRRAGWSNGLLPSRLLQLRLLRGSPTRSAGPTIPQKIESHCRFSSQLSTPAAHVYAEAWPRFRGRYSSAFARMVTSLPQSCSASWKKCRPQIPYRNTRALF